MLLTSLGYHHLQYVLLKKRLQLAALFSWNYLRHMMASYIYVVVHEMIDKNVNIANGSTNKEERFKKGHN